MATRRRASRQSVTGALTDLQRRVRYLQNRPAPTSLGNHSVIRSAIQPRAVSTDQIATNAISNDQIQADAVREAQILDDSITRDKIQNGEVVAGKLGQDSVFRGNITDGEVVDGKLAESSVNLINMKPNSVANTQLTTDSVNFRTVDTNAIGNENMLDNSVGNGELQNDSVGSGELQGDSVGFSELQASSVGTSTLQTGAVTRSKIGSAQVGTTQIENGAVTAAKIANQTITGNKIASRTLGDGQISSTYPAFAVSRGLVAGNGLSKFDNRISVRFGNTSTTVAPGNHSHQTGGPSSTTTLTGFGGQVVASSTHTHSTSTQRQKKEISEYTFDNPEKILNLVPKKYKYKNSLRNVHKDLNREWLHGYIAEEVLELGIEEAVGYTKNGEADSISYNHLVMYIIEILKNQKKEIETLKEKLGDA